MSKKESNGRYELPEEFKDIMDATAVLQNRLIAFYRKQLDAMEQSDINEGYKSEIIKPLEEAKDNLSELAGILLEYSTNLIRDQYYVRMDLLTEK